MTISEEKYFRFLKGEIVAIMQKTYPGIPDSISDWKGQNITDFQTELQKKQNQYISEKWFYTHMKSESSKLPRIDILNFLSQYVGYHDWEDFKHIRSDQKHKSVKKDNSNSYFYLVPLLVVVILTVFYFVYKSFYSQEYTFCFYDSISKQPISNNIIEVTVLEKNESNKNYLCDTGGCFTIKTKKRKIRFVVETPYYHRDTILRRLNSFNRTENVKLQIDDYAIMIHYFSNSNVKDWLKRKEDLNIIFADNAKIFQVYEGTVGMEIYNKWEFINKLTLPASGLRDIEILDTEYAGEKIKHLRFKQNGKVDEDSL